jgi:hypothetical protein
MVDIEFEIFNGHSSSCCLSGKVEKVFHKLAKKKAEKAGIKKKHMIRNMVAKALIVGTGWHDYFTDLQAETSETGVLMVMSFNSDKKAIKFLEDYYR